MKKAARYIIVSMLTILTFLMLFGVVSAAETAESTIKSNHLPYLVAGFSLIWAIFFAYLFYLHRKQIEIKDELLRLGSELEEAKR